MVSHSFLRSKRYWLSVILGGILLWSALSLSDQFLFWHRWNHRFWAMEDLGDFNQMAPDAQRKYLHKVLQCPFTENRDAAYHLFSIADKSSIPILIDALPSLKKYADQGKESGNITLIALTNQDFGFDQDAWKAWWEKNKEKGLDEIRLDGFREQGLPVVMPPDFDFAAALFKDRFNRSAQYFLKDLSDTLMNAVIGHSITSPEVEARLNAAKYLGMRLWHDGTVCKTALAGIYQREYSAAQLHYEEGLLRSLSQDPDNTVRIEALTRLNIHLRATGGFNEEKHVRHYEEMPDSVWRVKPGLDDAHLLLMLNEKTEGDRGDIMKLRYYNVQTQTTDWEYAYEYSYVFSYPVFFHEKVFFYINEHLHCLNVATGKVQWKYNCESNFPHPWQDLLYQDGQLYFSTENNILALDGNTGQVLWNTEIILKRGKEGPKAIRVLHEVVLTNTPTVLHALDINDGTLKWEIDLFPGREDEAQQEIPVRWRDEGLFGGSRRSSRRRSGPPEPRIIRRFECSDPYIYLQSNSNEILKIDASGTIHDQVMLSSPSLREAQENLLDVPVCNWEISLNENVLYAVSSLDDGCYLRAYALDSLTLLWERVFEEGDGRLDFFVGPEKIIYAFGDSGGALDKETGERCWEIDLRGAFPEFQEIDFQENFFVTCGPTGLVELRDYDTGEVLLSYFPTDMHAASFVVLKDRIVAGGDRMIPHPFNNNNYVGEIWLLNVPN